MRLPTAVYEYRPPGAPGVKGIRIERYTDGWNGASQFRAQVPHLDRDDSPKLTWIADSLGAVRLKLALAFDDPDLLTSDSCLRRIWVDPLCHSGSDESDRRPPLLGWQPRKSR